MNSKRILQTAILLLFSLTTTWAQEFSRSSTAPVEDLKPFALVPVNEFQLVLRQIRNCPCLPLDAILARFTSDAMIEVSPPGSTKKMKKYRPREYFLTVNGLTCMARPKYRYMNFNYLPARSSEGYASSFNGHPTIAFPMTQYFQAISSDGNHKVSDITIKEVHITYQQNAKGVWEFKIAGIVVTDSRPGTFNEQDAADTQS
jgi:hypothetical protein